MPRLIITSVFCLIGIVLGFFSPNINNQVVSGLINMAGIMAFFWQYVYTHMDKFYIAVNKVFQWCHNPNFKLIQAMTITFEDENFDQDFLEKLVRKLETGIKSEFGNYAKITSKPSGTDATIALDENGIASVNLNVQRVGEDKYQLYTEYKDSVNYNDRIKELETIRNVFSAITDGIHVLEKRLQIKLFFADRNPFYGYILKKSKGIMVDDFALSFKVNEKVDACVQKHYMEINSSNYTEFNNVLNNIIILANIKAS